MMRDLGAHSRWVVIVASGTPWFGTGALDPQLAQDGASADCMAPGNAAAQAAASAPSDDGEEEIWDPYAPLDPSSPGVLPIAPFKKGRAPTNRRRR